MDNCWVKSYSHIEQREHLPPLSLSLFFRSCWPTFMMLLLQPFHNPRPHFSTSDVARSSFFPVSERGLNEEIMAAAPFVAQVLERCTVGWELAGVTRLIWRCCRLWRTLTDRRTDKETYYMATLSCTAAPTPPCSLSHLLKGPQFYSLLLWNNYLSLFKTFMWL